MCWCAVKKLLTHSPLWCRCTSCCTYEANFVAWQMIASTRWVVCLLRTNWTAIALRDAREYAFILGCISMNNVMNEFGWYKTWMLKCVTRVADVRGMCAALCIGLSLLILRAQRPLESCRPASIHYMCGCPDKVLWSIQVTIDISNLVCSPVWLTLKLCS